MWAFHYNLRARALHIGYICALSRWVLILSASRQEEGSLGTLVIDLDGRMQGCCGIRVDRSGVGQAMAPCVRPGTMIRPAAPGVPADGGHVRLRHNLV